MKMDLNMMRQFVEDKFWNKPDDGREQIRVGDWVEVQMKLSLHSKVERRLSAAEKQYLKQKMQEGYTKEQLEEEAMTSQRFKGLVIGIKGKGNNKRIIIRRIASNKIGVERIVPLYSPAIESIKVTRKGKPRRAKLYYLRSRVGKKQLYVKPLEK